MALDYPAFCGQQTPAESGRPQQTWIMKASPQKDLADELESLRDEIAHLQSLIQHPVTEALPAKDSGVTSAKLPTLSVPLPPGLLEAAPFGMALVNIQFHIVSANRTLGRMLGYAEQEMQSLHIRI